MRRQAVLVRGTDTGMNLVRGVAGLHVRFRGDRLGEMDAICRRPPAIELPQRLAGGPARGVEMVDQPDDMVLYALKAPDRDAELNAGAAILDRHLKHRLTTADLISA